MLTACPAALCSTWGDYCSGRFTVNSLDKTRTAVVNLFISAVFYFIWRERNLRIHNPGKFHSATDTIHMIQEAVRSKLHTSVGFQKKALQDPSLISFIF